MKRRLRLNPLNSQYTLSKQLSTIALSTIVATVCFVSSLLAFGPPAGSALVLIAAANILAELNTHFWAALSPILIHKIGFQYIRLARL